MGGTALLGKSGFELETALIERVAAAKAGDPYAPLTILVGSNLLGAYVRRVLAEKTGGLFNVRFATFADIAGRLAQEAGFIVGNDPTELLDALKREISGKPKALGFSHFQAC